MPSLEHVACTVLQQCLKVQPSERVLVVDDRPGGSIAGALFAAALEMEGEALWMVMRPRERNGEEPPAPVAAAMAAAQVVVAPTSRSLTHTRARREACSAGARIATMPGVTEEIARRALVVDYAAMAERSEKIAAVLTEAARVRITSALGTDLSFSLAGRAGIADTGILDRPGLYGNLPAGEGFIAPVEGSAEGRLVVDASLAGLGVLAQPVILEIRGGAIARVSGGEGAARFQSTLEDAGSAGRVLCELGVGTNERAQVCGVVLEDEKVLGTVHIAFGNNVGFGGTNDVPFHVDGVVTRPTLEADGKLLIDAGRPLF